MEKRWVIRLFVAVGFVACASIAPKNAEACGGGDWEFVPAVDYRPQGLDKSEQDIHEGNHLSAAARIIRMFPELRKAKLGIDPKIDRAYRLLSLATARAGGSLAVEKEVPAWARGSWVGKTEQDRAANLTWAVTTMRSLNEAKKDDPALQTELGEVLARAPGNETEAREILGKLAQKDLISSPEGYAALAMLHAKSGDTAGREAAMKKCQAMAKSQSMCGDDRVAGTPAAGGRS
ncbi:MAG: hypothetical protein HUU21_02110 [Polyangiaceae bacterium]|nr:hypothetical protein [Polyangiaceae bacterium]NUQ72330.1 hypothetical protein [Polyangiaceae bacterium]